MRINGYSLQSGLLALVFYMALVLALVYYFNTRDTQKAKHFVPKNDKSIRVSLSSPAPNIIKKRVQKSTPKKVLKKRVPLKKTVIKKHIPKKSVAKKVIPKKVIPKKSVVKKVMPKKRVITTKELLASLKTTKKHHSPQKSAPLKKTRVSNSVANHSKKVPLDRGIANAYFAKVEDKLKGWPAQSEYAGEKAVVYVEIEPTGSFTFRVISASGNREFNEGLKTYLTQLQMFGFGRHRGSRAYTLNVEFIATE